MTPGKIRSFLLVFKNEGTMGATKLVNEKLTFRKVPQYSQEIDIVEYIDLKKEIKDYESIVFPEKEDPVVSIIIPVYNKFNYTYNCLKSILKFSGDKVIYEIIIADDCSNDLTIDIEKIVSNITVLKTKENIGFLKNCNQAAKKVKGKYILFLNNDTQVQKNWLLPLVELIENDDSIGAVGSKLLYESGLLQEAGCICWNDATALNYGKMGDPAMPEYNYVKEVDYISGASIMIRKSVWEELNGFDETFAPAYCEDADICFLIRKKGLKVIYQPKSVVVHFEGITNGTKVSEGQKQYQVINKDKFYNKWKDTLVNENFKNGDNVFHARDRSKSKKTLLMVDHYVPQFDMDAGSVTNFQYLKLFINLGYNVKFISSNYFKHEPYTGILEQMGIEVLYGLYYANNWKRWIKTNGKYIDYAYLNRPYIAVKYINEIRKYTNAKIIYYGHDLHFLREQREYKIKKEKRFLRSSIKWKKKELELMKKADMSYYPSQIEVDEIKKENQFINVKAIPAYIYENKPKKERKFEKTKDIMFIGGFNHKPNVDGVLWYVNEIYPELKKIRPDIKTYIIGSNAPEEILELNTGNIIITGYVTGEQLVEYYTNCRLSVVPLRYGAGIKGKIIEAMYYQTPVITTTIGAEGIKEAENCLFIKDDPLDFAEEILRVYDNFDLLSEVSVKEIDIVNKTFTMSAAKNIILDDLTE
jgi:GT2 family glycosyltransferase